MSEPATAQSYFSREAFLAGWVAGFVNLAVGHPFDTGKVRAQTGFRELPPSTSVVPKKGFLLGWIRFGYRGVTGPLLTAGLSQSLLFGSWRSTKDALENNLRNSSSEDTKNPSTLLCIDFVAGCVSGLLNAALCFPLVCVKVRAQIAPVAPPAFQRTPSFSTSLRETIVGMSYRTALQRGLFPHMIQETVGRGLYMAAYTGLSGQCGTSKTTFQLPELSRPLAGAAAGIMGWAGTYPCDVIRQCKIRDFYKANSTSAKQALLDTSLWTYGKNIYIQEGVKGLYKGIGFTLARAAPVACCTLPAYDYTWMWLRGERI